MSISQTKEWSDFHSANVGASHPKWPNEPMLKTLFGSYSANPLRPQSSWRVLDVGCGFGNNLVPFADLGCECHGIEIESIICTIPESLLGNTQYTNFVVW